MQEISTHISNPEPVLALLAPHLPYSLPLYRRLQFMNLPGGSTESSHILATFSSTDISRTNNKSPFTIAYLDLDRWPETEMWIYSSYEHPDHCTPAEIKEGEKQVLAMLRHIGGVVKEWEERLESESRGTPTGVVLCGTMHEKIFRFLVDEKMHGRKLVVDASEENLKFVFAKGKLPEQKLLSEGFEWGVVLLEDFELVLSRTAIARKWRTMKFLPSAAVKIAGRKDIVAWGFLGPDASLTTLHVEEAYRGKGLAKAVALKLFHERLHVFGVEGFGHADVVVENMASRGVCSSLGGEAMWSDYWAWVDLVVLEEAFRDETVAYSDIDARNA